MLLKELTVTKVSCFISDLDDDDDGEVPSALPISGMSHCPFFPSPAFCCCSASYTNPYIAIHCHTLPYIAPVHCPIHCPNPPQLSYHSLRRPIRHSLLKW